MQFRLITAILASAAVSGVAARSIQARQETGGDAPAAVVDAAESVATPPESGSGGSGSGFDFTQLANDAAQGAVPGAVGASNFAIPGFGGDGGININVTPPPPGTVPNPANPYYCQGNNYFLQPGCPGYRPQGAFYPPYPQPQPSWCDPYLNCYNWDCHPTQDYYGRNSCAPVRWGAPACPCTYY